MFKRPSAEVLGLSPSVDGARRFRGALFRLAGERSNWTNFLAAEQDGQVVGFAETGATEPALRDFARAALRSFGRLGSFHAAWLSWPRGRVDLATPPGALHLVELQVDPDKRNRGIGGALIEAVVRMGWEGRYPLISLTTATSNPARRLYERHGFSVVAMRTNRAYQRRTGAEGRVLMVKQLL